MIIRGGGVLVMVWMWLEKSNAIWLSVILYFCCYAWGNVEENNDVSCETNEW